MSDVILLNYHAAANNKMMDYWQEGSNSIAIPPTSVVEQHNKIGSITFGATFLCV